MTIPSSDNPYAVGPDGPLYLTAEEVAERFRMTPSGIRDIRAHGEGPLGVVFGRRVLYPLPAVQAWEQQQIERAKREQKRRAGAWANSAARRSATAPRPRS